MLELRAACERCGRALSPGTADARICSYECTFCASCAGEMHGICPNCGGELLPRPRRGIAAVATGAAVVESAPTRGSSALHHVSFGVADLPRSAAFYDAVLATLGFVRTWAQFDGEPERQAVGYGAVSEEDGFAIKRRDANARAPGPGFHLAFAAPDRASVVRFHAAALATGGTDAGPAGLRPNYGPHYFAAFVRDPDGYLVEAVCTDPDATAGLVAPSHAPT